MPDPISMRPAGAPMVAPLADGGQAPAKPPVSGQTAGPALAGDSLKTSAAAAAPKGLPATVFGDAPKPVDPPREERPWRVTSVNVRYAPMRVIYGKSDIHFQQPGYGTDVTIRDVKAEDRTSFEYLYTMPNGWPQLDEPQTAMQVGVGFANGYGVEANLKHNKYIVPVPGQMVAFEGTIAGQDVTGTRPLGEYVGQYEISGGLNQVSILGTKSLPLPAFSPKDRFSLVVKAGPGALVTYTNSHLMNDRGEMEKGPQQFHLGGYSLMGETELRYDIRKRVSLSLSNSFSYAHVASSQIAGGGKASQNILASQVAVGVGYTFNVKDRKKPPTDVAP